MTSTVRTGALLSEFEPTRLSWRSRGRLARGKITILDGDPGLGKSTLLTDWIAKVTTGRPLPDAPYGSEPNERGVILISAEDDPSDTIVPRLLAAGGCPEQVLLLNEVAVTNEEGQGVLDLDGKPKMEWFGVPDHIGVLEEAITYMNASLVIIDPIMAFLSPDVKSNSDQDVRQALSPLAKMAQRTGVSVVLVRHLNKSGGVNALYRGGGSIGIIALARIGLLLGRPKDQPDLRVLASVKNNISPHAPSLGFRLQSVPGTDVALMEYVGEVAYTAHDILEGDLTSEQEQDERDEAMIWLEDFLTGGPRNSKDVFAEGKKASISANALRIAKTKMGVIAKKQGYQGAWTWELAPKDPELEQKGFYDEAF